MAAGLAAELKTSLKIEAELIPGKGGVFQVRLDGNEMIFDKAEVGRFPILGEVTELLLQVRPEWA
jgi:predicted Rdx family selenoprotein